MIIKKKKQLSGEMEQIDNPQNVQDSSEDDAIDLFNLDNIDFKQRNERRRGDRRRGFRRIDDRNLISRAREEADSIREAAAKEGYQEGLNMAQEDIAQLRVALEEFQNAKQAVFDKITPEVLSISLDIAKKIIKQEVSQSPEFLANSVREILKSLSKEEAKVMIRVSPNQIGILKTEVPKIAETIGLDAKISIIPDETISDGGCIVTTNNGVVDATIETQIAIIREALKEI